MGIAPSSTSENSTNPELEQSNSFKLGKASEDVNESGSFSICLQPLMVKVDNTFKVFNAGRLYKEDKDCNLSTLSFENNVMNDGIVIRELAITQNSSRCTIDWMASGNVSNA
jgi:hypothetical protein